MTLQRLALIALLTVLALAGQAQLSFAQEALRLAEDSQGDDTLSKIARTQAQLDELLLTRTEADPAVIAARLKLQELKQRRAKEIECLRRVDIACGTPWNVRSGQADSPWRPSFTF